MSSLVVIGAQWGDEGKGKLVDYLTANADYVVRFQGGANAGHTLVVDGVKRKLRLIPSGVLREKTQCLIAAGVVLDPGGLLEEMEELRQTGVEITPKRLVLDRDAQLVLPYHKALDLAREEHRGKQKIGTTGRGIGPAYEDRANRSGVRVAELLHLEHLEPRLKSVVMQKNAYLSSVLESSVQVSFEEVWDFIQTAAQELTPYIGNVSLILDRAIRSDSRIIFEGAQGTLLDQMHGTVPFVTSANTIAGAVTTGCGIGPKHVGYVLGVAKAYSTRVGSGPFPSELDGPIADDLRERGAEFGTVTGRPRRCGWFDTVAMKRAVRLNGIDSLAITKLDILSGLEKIKICINYYLDGRKLEDVPSLAPQLEQVEPEYIELDGWEEPLESLEKWHQLPAAARLYLSTLSEIVECPVSIVSVGPERKSTIFLTGADYLKNFM